MSIQLKPLTIKDFEIYQRFYTLANYEGYQTNFHSLMLWNEVYQTQYYYNEHFLVTLMYYNGFYFWNVPLTTKEYFKEAMDAIFIYCKEHRMPFLMDAILLEQEKWLMDLYPDRLIFHHSLDNQSYIYEANINRTLSGKKMQKRRNHYNAFMKEYSHRFTYRNVTCHDKNEIAELYDRWAEDKNDYALIFEKKGVLQTIDHLNSLNYQMACIEIDGKIEAFILGSQLNHETVQIHVEKANKEIRGLYVAIFKLFLENEFSDVLYVNREEDMGIESLRKAKMQLHPIKLLDQSFAYHNDFHFCRATQNDIPLLKERWLSIFKEDTPEFLDNYFKNADLEIYLLMNDYQLVSTVYLRKINITIQNKEEIAYFIEGVSTHSLYEGKGYMKKLLEYSLNQHPDSIYFLQAYQWEIYKDFPFNHRIYKSLAIINQPLDLSKNYIIKKGYHKDHFNHLYQKFVTKYDGYINRDLLIDIDSYQWIYHDHAYAAFATFNDTIVICEIVYETKEDGYALVNYLIELYHDIKVICEPDFLNGEELLFIKSNKKLPSIYFNEYI